VKTIFSSLNLIEMHHLKNLLQSEGIPCRIRNEDLSRLAGEIPFTECALQLVIERERDYAAAEAILREFLRPPRRTPDPPWLCRSCGETIEEQFTACWKCGERRTED
jgi:TPP-dependent indolepyruvate ferredoxin oxidoreductase alpha subunit